MKHERFPLLSVKNDDGSKLVGPLARVLADEVEKRPAVFKLASMMARVAPGKQVELLGMHCMVGEDGAFDAKPTGLAGRFIGKKPIAGVVEAIRRRGKPVMIKDGRLVYTMFQPPVPSKASMKLLAHRLSVERTGRPSPTVITCQITTRCQADCVHCSAARHKGADRPEMTTEQIKTLIRQSEAAGVVTIVFTGGEPMLRKDIYELVSYVDKDEAVALLFSNGLMLSEENVGKLKDAGLWGICVSIDSPDAAAHDALRHVPGCFEKATNGLRRCKEAGMITAISTYATPERLHSGQIQQMIKLSEDVGVDELIIFDVVPTGRLLKQDTKFLLNPEDQQELCRIEEEQNSRHTPPQIITQAHVNGPTGVGCYAGWCQFYVTAYGDMTPCDFTPLTFGNVLEEGVDAVWDRMTAHDAYCKRSNHCRMQDPEFRAKFINKIPHAGPFPFPADRLENLPEAEPETEEIETEVEEYSSVGIKA